MGKLRLNCPNCGKAVAVSETAKKARCPGCKQVMDVAAALAGDTDPSSELTGAAVAEAGQPADAGGVPPQEDGGAQAEGAPEEQAEKPKSGSRRISRRSGRKSGRTREEGAGGETPESEAPPPSFNLPGGAQPWMIIAGVGLVLAILLFFVANVQWYAAIMVVCGLGLYVDAAIMRVTRVTPSSQGTTVAPMVWGLIGFTVLGVVAYGLIRRKLVENSPQDIASPDMDDDDMAYEGKIRAPSVASVGMVLVLGLAVGAGMFCQRPLSMELKIGTGLSKNGRFVLGQSESGYYDAGALKGWFRANDPLEDYEGLNFDVLKIGADHVGVSVASGELKANVGSRIVTFAFDVTDPGLHRLDIKDKDNTVYASEEFRIRQQ